MKRYARAKYPTPILNSPDFSLLFGGSNGSSLPLDEQGLFRPLETIALKGTKFKLEEPFTDYIYRVVSNEYQGAKLFVDIRFLEDAEENDQERQKILPSPSSLLEHLESLEGLPYVWGGNFSRGVEHMYDFYPPKNSVDLKTENLWKFKGVDCSGLLYEVTDGFTPRNTSELIHFGASLELEDRCIEEILSYLQPLDLIVWKGHVVIALNRSTFIESRLGQGVVKSSSKLRLEEILSQRRLVKEIDPKNSHETFVIKRWLRSSSKFID